MASAGLCPLAGGPLLPQPPGAPLSLLGVPARRAVVVLSAGGHPCRGILPLSPPAIPAPLPLPPPVRSARSRRPQLPKASAGDFPEGARGGGAGPVPAISSAQSDGGELSSDGLMKSAGLVGAATVASKFLGLLREVAVASVFGVGPVATAFNHATVLPRFCSSFLGGVNGPIHVAVATTLSKLPKGRRKQLIQKMHVIVFLVGVVVSAVTFLFAEPIIHMSAPGLWVLAEGRLIGEIASTQERNSKRRFTLILWPAEERGGSDPQSHALEVNPFLIDSAQRGAIFSCTWRPRSSHISKGRR